MVSLSDGQLAGLWVVRLFDQALNLASGVAESREGTELFSVVESHRRPVIRFRLSCKRRPARRLFSVESNFLMSIITERLSL